MAKTEKQRPTRPMNGTIKPGYNYVKKDFIYRRSWSFRRKVETEDCIAYEILA
jgi:hypothetical protein